jgi:hypothetical protein
LAGESRSEKNLDEDVEAALLDADLFVKYRAANRAVERLQAALTRHPRSIQLREKLREVALVNKQPQEAARQCLALASLYIARESLDAAHDRLLQAKQLDPRISITTGLEAVRRARRTDTPPTAARPAATTHPTTLMAEQGAAPPPPPPPPTLAGDLSSVSIFDAVQIIENARLTGALRVEGEGRTGRVLFNEGLIVGAEVGEAGESQADKSKAGESDASRAEADKSAALESFRLLLEITAGSFHFDKSTAAFPTHIQTPSNTSLILDSLREIDESNQ